MKDCSSLKVSIAGEVINLEINGLTVNHYIKSVLKNHLTRGGKPFFSITVDSGKEQPAARDWNISAIHRNGKFVFIHKEKNKPGIEIGFIDRKKRTAKLNSTPENIKVLFHPFLLSCCAYFFPEIGGFILHAAGVIFKGDAYIFIGPSGSGKTTIANILKEKGISVISDEKIVIQRKKDLFFAFGFPWGSDKNIRAPAEKIFFLKKSGRISFSRLSRPDAIARIFPQIALNISDKKTVRNILDALSLLFKKVPGYKMEFLKNDLFWDKAINLS